jgi:hypothetical protein
MGIALNWPSFADEQNISTLGETTSFTFIATQLIVWIVTIRRFFVTPALTSRFPFHIPA